MDKKYYDSVVFEDVGRPAFVKLRDGTQEQTSTVQFANAATGFFRTKEACYIPSPKAPPHPFVLY